MLGACSVLLGFKLPLAHSSWLPCGEMSVMRRICLCRALGLFQRGKSILKSWILLYILLTTRFISNRLYSKDYIVAIIRGTMNMIMNDFPQYSLKLLSFFFFIFMFLFLHIFSIPSCTYVSLTFL